MQLNQLCKLNEIVSRVDSQEDAEKKLENFFEKECPSEHSYIKYYCDAATDAECVVINDELHDIKHFVFKGTNSLKDWESNLDFYPIENIPNCPEYKIHRGFYKQWEGLSGFLLKEVEVDTMVSSKRKKICISGHSLGGAIAILCAIHMYCISDGIVERVCTFGAPRVLCQDMARWYNVHLKEKTIRVVNFLDTIPKLPLAGPILKYQHVDSTKILFKYGYLAPDNGGETPSLSYYYKTMAGFFKGLLLRSGPHQLKTYLDNIDSFTFFTQFPVY